MSTTAALALGLVIACAPKATAQDVELLRAELAQLRAEVAAIRSAVPWDGPPPKIQLGGACGPERYCLGTASVVSETGHKPNGGPQAFEGYTLTQNPAGTVIHHASGTIGNIEIAGEGQVDIARGLTTGIVVSGPGVVKHATTLNLSGPQRKSSYTGPINVESWDFITFFDQGKHVASIRFVNGTLLLCYVNEKCRPL